MQMAGRRAGWGAAPRKRAVPPRPRPAGTGKARQGQGQDSGHEAPPRANVLSSALGVLQCPWVCNFWGQQADMKRICCCSAAKSCPTLQPHGLCGPPGSSVHGISQARILELAAMPSSRRSSPPRDRTHVSCIGRQNSLPPSHQGSP